ncbi:hypothetical protein ACUY3M_10185 [Corynebacterium suicordis]
MIPMRELVSHSIGGGWGEDIHADGTEQVAIIRGADFPGVAVGDTSAIPRRWESIRKLPQRTLQPGDIVLESSGGTSDRPTGRTVFISEQLLDRFDVPVIPASFCRLVRIDPSMADPHYVYWWLQGMYADGRTWGYQNRSTGIANFQFQHFLDAEKVNLPTPDEQRAIAATLGTLDDKIESNRRAIRTLQQLGDAILVASSNESRLLSDIADITMGSSPKGADLNEDGDGLPFYQGTRDFGFRFPTLRVWTTAPVRTARKDDTLISVRAPVGELNRAGTDCCIGRGVAAIHSETRPSTLYYAMRSSRSTWNKFQGEGTVFASVNKADVHDAEIRWVGDDLILELEEKLQAIDARIESLERACRRLAALRDTLLPELISGRVQVPTDGDRA